MSDYERISKAIAFIRQHVHEQPELDEIAQHVHLSPFHFQRLFKRWAGTTPKRFLQVLTLELGKKLLDQDQSILDVSENIGLSSTSRLHDHFVQIEAITPGEYKSKGKGLEIRYATHDTPFGNLFIATTSKGICRASFIDRSIQDEEIYLHKYFTNASFIEDKKSTANLIEQFFSSNQETKFHLHIAGTNFQLAVWQALLRIPSAKAISYGELANHLQKPGASRAVGTAVGANPIAFLIPCHRVIQQSGALGGYRWGLERKEAFLAWEKLHVDYADESIHSINSEK